ncbi:tetratricopeptide repeat protein [Vicingus serpentipes]|uniref:Tetratricopeptide repeat protein n=1 Tax=Vicingus serpentipes TaxID=1926625 RepID=A0A5C6RY84_9FLAO|nr:tetratricopeptide repeat protein [Vicingus serpentipes]TXB67027.1 tetratricopeptide repeat protein [Vicingus serpentipes]
MKTRLIKYCFINFYLLLLFINLPQQSFSNEKIVKLESSSLNQDTSKVNLYIEIAQDYIDTNFVMALKYAQKANNLSQKINYQSGYITSLRLLSDANDYLGRYSEAQEINFKMLDHYKKINDEEEIHSTNINIGIINYYQENYDQSIDYTFRALSYYQNKDDLTGISICYNNLANVYSDRLDYKTALKYYFKALALDEETNNKDGIALIKGNIGEVYIELQEFDKALKFLEEALAIAEEINDQWQQANLMSGLGNLLFKKGQQEDALNYLFKALEINQKLGAVAEQSEIYQIIYQVYETRKQFDKAFYYLNLYTSLNDSVYNKETVDKIAEMNAIYEIEEKEEELRNQEELAEYQKNQKIALILSLVLLLGIVFISIRGNLTKKKINETLAQQKILIETKNRDITDSIQYAKQIQSAILPSDETIKKLFASNFVFYKPKDIVAGDFYWALELPNQILFAVADCTGHGVPGAMVSVVCNSALNRAVKEFNLNSPAKILDKATEIVIETFEKSNSNIKDGMDIALCSFDKETNELEYAGANNSIYLIRNGELIETKADKQPVGKFVNSKPFTNKQIKLEKNDSLYLFTDGYSDQFGGPKGKKYKYKAFKQLLINIHKKAMNEQKQIIYKSFIDWQGNLEQIDDVCIVGIRI